MIRPRARWERAVVLVAQCIGAAGLVILMLQVSANGLLRRLVGIQIPFTLELTEWWYMPLVACTGIAIAAIQQEHFYVDLVFERLSPVGKRLLAGFASILAVVFTLAITYFTFIRALNETAVFRYEPVTGLPIWPLYFLIPLAFAAYSMVLLSGIVRIVVGNDIDELIGADGDEDVTELTT